MKTLFEKIADREEPATFHYEDDELMIIDNKYPKAPIHYLIIPKRPIASLSATRTADADVLGKLLLLAGAFARDEGIEDYKVVFNAGAHQHIPHIHAHFLAGDLS